MLSFFKAVMQAFAVVIITWTMLAVMFFIQTAEPEQVAAEPIASIEVIGYTPEVPQVEPQLEYIGEFTMTGFCPCEQCCGKWAGSNTASGTVPTSGRTVGADWSVLTAGTEIYIEGYGYRVIEDKPAGWIIKKYDEEIIDVFCATHEDALAVGRQTVKVYQSIKQEELSCTQLGSNR